MSGVGARAAGARNGSGRADRHPRTPAQWYTIVFGATLVLVGLIGFLANASFETGRTLEEDPLLGIFDVNGWHNIVHIASGAFLLALSPRRGTAKFAAISFGVVYGLVAIIGLIDGSDVFAFIPVNAADNVLHIVISAVGIVAGLMSKGDHDEVRDAGVVGTGTDRTTRREPAARV